METLLKKIGFSEYKARAYTTLVKLDHGTPLDVARKAHIPTSKIYEVLHWLNEQGYISVTSQKPLHYKANDPKSLLLTHVQEKIQHLDRIRSEIKQLSTFIAPVERGSFQIVFGRDAFFAKVKESVARTRKSIVAIVKHWRFDYDLLDSMRACHEKKVEMRMLGPIDKKTRPLVRCWTDVGVRVAHHIPEETRYTVWDGRIITIGFKGKEKDYFSLWIENEYLGKILTDHFNRLWKEGAH